MLGVTPAAAAEAAIRVAANADTAIFQPAQDSKAAAKVRTRLMALAERQAEVDTRAAAVTAQEQLHGEAAAALAGVNGRLKQAHYDYKASRKAKPGLERDVRRKIKAEKAASPPPREVHQAPKARSETRS